MIQQRLRDWASHTPNTVLKSDLRKAADEIERLQVELRETQELYDAVSREATARAERERKLRLRVEDLERQ